jgi:hypothetical protein
MRADGETITSATATETDVSGLEYNRSRFEA